MTDRLRVGLDLVPLGDAAGGIGRYAAELLRALAEQGVRPGASMMARVVDGSVSLDGRVLPAGVAQHVFVSPADQDATSLQASSPS